ncbi:phosphotransferase [Kribbella sp. NPDC004536]|uniref:phosphotransferase n=1 Tax=Kribbella sp. NPDC004536 TaxID=3364106 RepID=UPI003694160B
MRWVPGDGWVLLAPAKGVAHGGVWRTPDGTVVKRLVPGDERPGRYGYWRRQAEVASSGVLEWTKGLRAPRAVKVETDPDGITLWTEGVVPGPVSVDEAAAALGRFGLNRVEPANWFARRILRDRLDDDAAHGGWAGCATADVLPADVRRLCGELWTRRTDVLRELDRLPHQLVHGDIHPPNLLRRDGDDLIAVDFDQFGIGPLGFDLGYLLQSTRAPIAELVAAYQAGSSEAWSAADVRRGAVLTAAITLVARAAWALTQPDPGEHLERLVAQTPIVDEAVRHASYKAE